MKYFLIAGEASGDLHASHLITAIRERDHEAEFRFYGGDLMEQAATGPICDASAPISGTSPLLRHYKTLAYMGFVQVALHARTILRGLADCKRAIAEWAPDCVILVDYPGFNLKIAKWVHTRWNVSGSHRPQVYYYISPKIWAWKEHRINAIREYVDRLFSILPFEVDFYEGKHHYPISYVGNPTYDEVQQFLAAEPAIEASDTIALLPGSRQQEIRDNLRIMLSAVGTLPHTIAAAPGIDDDFYRSLAPDARIVRGKTYELLVSARAALVTSGTATLEAALLDCPQVVCYKMTGGRIVNWLKPYFLKCRWISLVNLIADREVVPELIAADMNSRLLTKHLHAILNGPEREMQLRGYDLIRERLATPGAPQKAAEEIIHRLKGGANY